VSVSTLAVALGGAGRSTVKRLTAQLVAFGVIDVLVGRGRGRQNTYRLDLAPETKHPVGNGPSVGRFRKENGPPGAENGPPGASHIGEVEGEVEERERERIDLSTLRPGDVVRCPRRPSRAGCSADCPICHGMHHVHAELLLDGPRWWDRTTTEVTS
jgi:hypothetical protein